MSAFITSRLLSISVQREDHLLDLMRLALENVCSSFPFDTEREKKVGENEDI